MNPHSLHSPTVAGRTATLVALVLALAFFGARSAFGMDPFGITDTALNVYQISQIPGVSNFIKGGLDATAAGSNAWAQHSEKLMKEKLAESEAKKKEAEKLLDLAEKRTKEGDLGTARTLGEAAELAKAKAKKLAEEAALLKQQGDVAKWLADTSKAGSGLLSKPDARPGTQTAVKPTTQTIKPSSTPASGAASPSGSGGSPGGGGGGSSGGGGGGAGLALLAAGAAVGGMAAAMAGGGGDDPAPNTQIDQYLADSKAKLAAQEAALQTQLANLNEAKNEKGSTNAEIFTLIQQLSKSDSESKEGTTTVVSALVAKGAAAPTVPTKTTNVTYVTPITGSLGIGSSGTNTSKGLGVTNSKGFAPSDLSLESEGTICLDDKGKEVHCTSPKAVKLVKKVAPPKSNIAKGAPTPGVTSPSLGFSFK